MNAELGHLSKFPILLLCVLVLCFHFIRQEIEEWLKLIHESDTHDTHLYHYQCICQLPVWWSGECLAPALIVNVWELAGWQDHHDYLRLFRLGTWHFGWYSVVRLRNTHCWFISVSESALKWPQLFPFQGFWVRFWKNVWNPRALSFLQTIWYM